MEFEIVVLVAAFGGGLFGAAVGALPAFVFTGFLTIFGVVLALTGGSDYDILGDVAFGPVFGPHISFAGGVAGAAYAKQRGKLGDGTDIIKPLAGLNAPDVLLVGGVFGAIGYLGQWALSQFLGDFTDVIALMVALSGILVRVVFGQLGVFGTLADDAVTDSRFAPGGEAVWLPFQQDWLQAGAIGLGAGLIASFMSLGILDAFPDATGPANVIGFGIAAATLVFLSLGLDFPVTHHMTISASYAAVASENLLIGVVAGVVAALVGEAAARIFLIHGDTHIDPPAVAIAIMSAFAFVPLAI